MQLLFETMLKYQRNSRHNSYSIFVMKGELLFFVLILPFGISGKSNEGVVVVVVVVVDDVFDEVDVDVEVSFLFDEFCDVDDESVLLFETSSMLLLFSVSLLSLSSSSFYFKNK